MSATRKMAYALDWRPVKTWHAKYASGEMRVEDMAREFGCGADMVRAWFKRHGLSATIHARYRVGITADELRAFHARYLAGEKMIVLAEEARTSTQNMLALFKRAGLDTYRKGQHPNSRAGRGPCPADMQKNAPRFTGSSTRSGSWTKTDEHECIAADGVCLLCDQPARMQA